ncbi:MAG: hypothetical protein UW95_C0006G0032 [Parcubacteria group bacterium GW2011_GWC1_45_14]|nr:MAG: hypothetical protein UW95_C0006G0032 [Parcubacteria group bacterium GW2011_GWC1_45_14]
MINNLLKNQKENENSHQNGDEFIELMRDGERSVSEKISQAQKDRDPKKRGFDLDPQKMPELHLHETQDQDRGMIETIEEFGNENEFEGIVFYRGKSLLNPFLDESYEALFRIPVLDESSRPIPEDVSEQDPRQGDPKNVADVERPQMGKHAGGQHEKLTLEDKREKKDRIARVAVRFDERNE